MMFICCHGGKKEPQTAFGFDLEDEMRGADDRHPTENPLESLLRPPRTRKHRSKIHDGRQSVEGPRVRRGISRYLLWQFQYTHTNQKKMNK